MHYKKQISLIVLILGFVNLNLFSQETNLIQSYEMKPLHGKGAEFETAFKAHVKWRVENGETWSWQVWQEVTGRNLGTFYVRSGGHTWADFDAYGDFLAKGTVQFWKQVGPYIQEPTATIQVLDLSMSNRNPNLDEINLASVVRYSIIPGKGRAFMAGIKEFHEAIVKDKYPVTYVFLRDESGTVGPNLYFAFGYKNWADMEEEETFMAFSKRVLGEKKMDELYSKINTSFSQIETSILVRRRDLEIDLNK